jgi:hypothetical protein
MKSLVFLHTPSYGPDAAGFEVMNWQNFQAGSGEPAHDPSAEVDHRSGLGGGQVLRWQVAPPDFVVG